MRNLITLAALMLLLTGAAMAESFTSSFTDPFSVAQATGALTGTPNGGRVCTANPGSGTYAEVNGTSLLTLYQNRNAPDISTIPLNL